MPLAAARPGDAAFIRAAFEEARLAFDEMTVPVGAVMTRDGAIIARGRNRFVGRRDPTAHAEIECLRAGGVQPGYAGVTLYTTLSPCLMCAGAVLFLGIPRVVIADTESYAGDVAFMAERGVEVSVTADADCVALMRRFTTERASLWREIAGGNRG